MRTPGAGRASEATKVGSAKLKYYYVTCARVPGKKAHCSQIAQMCRAFIDAGLDMELLHPARSMHGEYEGATIEDWYGFDRSIPSRRLFCIDYLGRIPSIMPHYLTSMAHRLMVATFNFSMVRYLRKLPGDFGIYSRDPRVMRRVKQVFPGKRAYLELHMLRDWPRPEWEEQLFQSVDGIIVVTRKMKEMLYKRGVPEDRVIVEPNGVDQSAFPGTVPREEARNHLDLDPTRRYVTFVGNFRAMNVDRGLGTIVQAVPRVIREFPEVTFLFVGGPLQSAQEYIGELKGMGIDQKHFMFVDRQPYNEIHYWLAASEVLVHPVPDHPIYTNITSPLKVFEYMTAGRPIVASDLPSIREVLENGKTALLAAPGDSEGFANAFLKALSDDKLTRRLARNSKKDVLERTWESRAARIRDWLETT